MQTRTKTILESMLAAGGPVARAMSRLTSDRFEVRGAQREMAAGVCAAQEGKSHLLVEAGTGTGKSFAYLLPSALRCVLFGEKVVIATHTISLQEQLIEKDIPLVRSVIEAMREAGDLAAHAQTPEGEVRSLQPILVKGRGNYVSIRRLRLASERQERLFSDAAQRRSLQQIEDWAYTTTDGTLSSLPTLERMGVWDKVQSDSGNCMGRKCPNHAQCFYQKARAALEDANMLVCNHALFFSDLALRAQDAGFLPQYSHVVFDEAHTVEEVAGEHFGANLSEGRVAHLLTTLYQARTGKGYLPHLSLSMRESSGVERAVSLTLKAMDASRAFFDALAGLMRGGEGHEGQDPSWISRGAARTSPESQTIRIRERNAIPNTLSDAMRELVVRLRSLRDECVHEADRYELNAYAQRAEMIATDADTLVSLALPHCAYWVEGSTNPDMHAGGLRRLTLACAPIEVDAILKERLFSGEASVVLTSATIATRTPKAGEQQEHRETAFAHAMQRLGCVGAASMQLTGGFDYARQVRFILDTRTHAQSSPIRAGQGDAPRLASLILEHVRETNGGAFVLFTSYAMLSRCRDLLRSHLEREGLPMLAQGFDGSRTAMLQAFRASDRAVLLGAASFWQGVDVRGDTLRNVIITKLPFDPPDRPLTQARLERIEARGGNPFMEESLPRAVLRFKQGFGRLVRSQTDTGRVVVLDARIRTARYGRVFLDSLPVGTSGPMRPEVLTSED